MARDLQSLIDKWEEAMKKTPIVAREKLEAVLVFLVDRIKDNTPGVEGTLAKTVRFEIEDLGKGIVVGTIIVGNAQVPYALDVHENTERPLDGSTLEGGRGPKYVTRVFDYHRDVIGRLGPDAVKVIFKQ